MWTNGLAVTVGAQLGVLLPSWLVFHRMPALGIGANLLAVPVAVVVMGPTTLGTKCVATVADTTARLEPHGLAAVLVWVA